jgi:hypothetical protein
MKDHIRQVFDSGLSLSVVDGRLKVAGTPETVDALRPLLQQYRSEIIRKLQNAGAAQDCPAMPEHASPEANAAQATPAQRATNDAERLAAWERGEWVTIPNTAESLEIYQAIEIEQTARRRRLFAVAEELSKSLTTIDQISQEQRPDDYNFALSVLRSRVEDARPWLARGNA